MRGRSPYFWWHDQTKLTDCLSVAACLFWDSVSLCCCFWDWLCRPGGPHGDLSASASWVYYSFNECFWVMLSGLAWDTNDRPSFYVLWEKERVISNITVGLRCLTTSSGCPFLWFLVSVLCLWIFLVSTDLGETYLPTSFWVRYYWWGKAAWAVYRCWALLEKTPTPELQVNPVVRWAKSQVPCWAFELRISLFLSDGKGLR